MFTVMMSGYEVDLFSKSHNPVVSIILLVLFVFIMSMVLLNCLIALMSGDGALLLNKLLDNHNLRRSGAELCIPRQARLLVFRHLLPLSRIEELESPLMQIWCPADAAAKVNDMEGWQFMFSRAQIIGRLSTLTLPFCIFKRPANSPHQNAPAQSSIAIHLPLRLDALSVV